MAGAMLMKAAVITLTASVAKTAVHVADADVALVKTRSRVEHVGMGVPSAEKVTLPLPAVGYPERELPGYATTSVPVKVTA
jgi:hypothetical protein